MRLGAYSIEEEADCVSSTPNEDHDDHVPAPPIGSEPDAKGCGKDRDEQKEPPIAYFVVPPHSEFRITITSNLRHGRRRTTICESECT
jgi:hypothetical protein